jgi:hypothetical protein
VRAAPGGITQRGDRGQRNGVVAAEKEDLRAVAQRCADAAVQLGQVFDDRRQVLGPRSGTVGLPDLGGQVTKIGHADLSSP